MTESTRSFLFPDINVWVALTYDGHVHHTVASTWFDGIAPSTRLFFSRLTQLGFLRLLTSSAVMGTEVKSQQEAWKAYDYWLNDERIEMLAEPDGFESEFRSRTRSSQASPKDWADSYILALAASAGLRIVTFDQALRSRSKAVLSLL